MERESAASASMEQAVPAQERGCHADARDVRVLQSQDSSPEEREAAFEALRSRYYNMVYKVARQFLNALDAEDVAQEVFIHMHQKIDDLRNPYAFGAWLKRIALRMRINRCVRTKVHHALDANSGEGMDRVGAKYSADSMTPLDQLMLLERMEAVRAAIEQLLDIDKEILKLFYFQRLRVKEIQSLLRIPAGTVKRRLHVARHRLAVLIAEQLPVLMPNENGDDE